MKDIPQFENDAAEVNMELSKKLEDGKVHAASTEGISEAASANLKLQDAFYADHDKSDIAPTYMSNNTPAIKINNPD